MKKIFLLYIVISLAFIQFSKAQGFNADEQYSQAMQNAKQAFEAQQFSEAVMFYREAIKIKPDALLPRYKIEDIRTIYIEKELDSLKTEPLAVEQAKVRHKRKKEAELEKAALAEKAKADATRKMNEDADKAAADLRNLEIAVIDIDDDIAQTELTDQFEVADIAGDKEVLIKKVEIKEQQKIKNGVKTTNNTLIIDKREVPVVPDVIEKTEKKPIPVKVVAETAPVKKAEHKTTKPPTTTIKTTNKKAWVEQEQERLAAVYPNKKTIEEIDKPGKHITRVIMNIDNKVTVYLKVKHSWGATYFFIDEVGNELRSINQQYFNLMTNLKTYGG